MQFWGQRNRRRLGPKPIKPQELATGFVFSPRILNLRPKSGFSTKKRGVLKIMKSNIGSIKAYL